MPGTKAGGPVRSIFSLTSLLKTGYDFYIITTNNDLGSNLAYKDIQPDVFFEKDELTYYYFSKEELNSKNVINKINEINPDLVYINSFWSYFFSINIIKAKSNGLLNFPVLLAPRGMLSKGALGLKPLKKNLFLLFAKLSGAYKNVFFHATNQEEKNDILNQFKKAKVFLAPNINSGTIYSISKPKQEKGLKLFYLSRIAKVKNLAYALEVLALVPKDYDVEYDIYGNIEDKLYWENCLSLITKLPSNIKVKYRQELQFNEVQSIISSYHALFLPTLNENFGHSIVESLLCGCVAIISDQTPWNDLEKNNAGYALSLNDKQAFVNAITELADLNGKDYGLKSEAAINYISGKLNIEKNLEQYKSIFNESGQK
ncbi:MAG: group 1 glycosyl transferase [Bacteroidetes bacterium]|nr:group 1 glycosyl transferase [Bacteroidota bacterium]